MFRGVLFSLFYGSVVIHVLQQTSTSNIFADGFGCFGLGAGGLLNGLFGGLDYNALISLAIGWFAASQQQQPIVPGAPVAPGVAPLPPVVDPNAPIPVPVAPMAGPPGEIPGIFFDTSRPLQNDMGIMKISLEVFNKQEYLVAELEKQLTYAKDEVNKYRDQSKTLQDEIKTFNYRFGQTRLYVNKNSRLYGVPSVSAMKKLGYLKSQ